MSSFRATLELGGKEYDVLYSTLTTSSAVQLTRRVSLHQASLAVVSV